MGLWDTVWIIAAFAIVSISGCSIPNEYQNSDFLRKTNRNNYEIVGFTNDSVVNETYQLRIERVCRNVSQTGRHVVIHGENGSCYWLTMMVNKTGLMIAVNTTVSRTIDDCIRSPPKKSDIFRVMPAVEQTVVRCPFMNYTYYASIAYPDGTKKCTNNRKSTIKITNTRIAFHLCDELDPVTVNLPTMMHCMATIAGTFMDTSASGGIVLLGAFNSSYIFPSTLHCARYVVTKNTAKITFITVARNLGADVYADCTEDQIANGNIFTLTLTPKKSARSNNYVLGIAVIVGFASGLLGICIGACLTQSADLPEEMIDESVANTESLDSLSDRALKFTDISKQHPSPLFADDDDDNASYKDGGVKPTSKRTAPPAHFHGNSKFVCTGCGTKTDLAVIQVKESLRPSVSQDDAISVSSLDQPPLSEQSASIDSAIPHPTPGTITLSSDSFEEKEEKEEPAHLPPRRVSTHSHYLGLLSKYKADTTSSLKTTDRRAMAAIRARRIDRAANLKRERELSNKYSKKHSVCE